MKMRPLAFSLIGLLLLAGCVGPAGSDVYRIPFSSSPTLDGKIAPGEWDQATIIQGSFDIADGTAANGTYPFQLHLCHDDKWLYLMLHVQGVVPNPFDHGSQHHSIDAAMFFDTEFQQSGLKSPEDLKSFSMQPLINSTSTDDGFWDGHDWTLQTEGSDSQHLPWNGTHPGSGTWGYAGFSDRSLSLEAFIPLQTTDKIHDGFQISDHGRFRLMLELEITGGPDVDRHGFFRSARDTFPGEGYGPNNMYNPTWLNLQLA